jgi:hypothetical protein
MHATEQKLPEISGSFLFDALEDQIPHQLTRVIKKEESMRKFLKPILILFLTFTLVSCMTLAESQVRKRIKNYQDRQAALLSSEKMHVILLGTGGPLANETRDSSGVAIIAGGAFIVVDVGPGIVRNMNLSNLPGDMLSALFLTHFHSDHISDMGELSFSTWARGRAKKLDVYGPEGVEQVVNGYNMAYGLDSSYRTAHHSEEWMPSKNSGMIPNTLTITDPEKQASTTFLMARSSWVRIV